jgi:hypothetical protein
MSVPYRRAVAVCGVGLLQALSQVVFVSGFSAAGFSSLVVL